MSTEREFGALQAQVTMLKEQQLAMKIENDHKFKEINDKIDSQFKEINDKIDGKFEQVNTKLEENFNTISSKLDLIEGEKHYSKGFLRAVVVIFSVLGAILGATIKYFKP